MYLPAQTEPIERKLGNEKQADSGGVEPQQDCYCLGNPPTWHCWIGKDLYDTGIECP